MLLPRRVSWICCQAATYAVGDAVNCRQVDVNIGVGTLEMSLDPFVLQNLRHDMSWT